MVIKPCDPTLFPEANPALPQNLTAETQNFTANALSCTSPLVHSTSTNLSASHDPFIYSGGDYDVKLSKFGERRFPAAEVGAFLHAAEADLLAEVERMKGYPDDPIPRGDYLFYDERFQLAMNMRQDMDEFQNPTFSFREMQFVIRAFQCWRNLWGPEGKVPDVTTVELFWTEPQSMERKRVAFGFLEVY